MSPSINGKTTFNLNTEYIIVNFENGSLGTQYTITNSSGSSQQVTAEGRGGCGGNGGSDSVYAGGIGGYGSFTNISNFAWPNTSAYLFTAGANGNAGASNVSGGGGGAGGSGFNNGGYGGDAGNYGSSGAGGGGGGTTRLYGNHAQVTYGAGGGGGGGAGSERYTGNDINGRYTGNGTYSVSDGNAGSSLGDDDGGGGGGGGGGNGQGGQTYPTFDYDAQGGANYMTNGGSSGLFPNTCGYFIIYLSGNQPTPSPTKTRTPTPTPSKSPVSVTPSKTPSITPSITPTRTPTPSTSPPPPGPPPPPPCTCLGDSYCNENGTTSFNTGGPCSGCFGSCGSSCEECAVYGDPSYWSWSKIDCGEQNYVSWSGNC